MTTEKPSPATPLDLTRRVFAIPVTYKVTGTLYVLASELTAARLIANRVDLDGLVTPRHDYVYTTDTSRLIFDDIEPMDVHVMGALPVSTYNPKEHPDWCPELTTRK